MTDLEKMAREAGFDTKRGAVYVNDTELTRSMERFAQAVARRCAEICAGMGDGPFVKGWDSDDYAAAIRAEFGIGEA